MGAWGFLVRSLRNGLGGASLGWPAIGKLAEIIFMTLFLLLTSRDPQIRCSGDYLETFLSLCCGPGAVLGDEVTEVKKVGSLLPWSWQWSHRKGEGTGNLPKR